MKITKLPRRCAITAWPVLPPGSSLRLKLFRARYPAVWYSLISMPLVIIPLLDNERKRHALAGTLLSCSNKHDRRLFAMSFDSRHEPSLTVNVFSGIDIETISVNAIYYRAPRIFNLSVYENVICHMKYVINKYRSLY